MIDVSSLSYRSVLPCRSVAKKQVGKLYSFTIRGSVGLWARHEAARAKIASTVIQPIVMACIQMMRRTTF